MKLISWNVNGVRAIMKRGFFDFIAKTKADAYCFQEVKATGEQALKASEELGVKWPKAYEQIWYPAQKAGYSGTAILTKPKPVSVTSGMGMDEHDSEGRVLTVEYDDLYLVNVYTPNAKNDLSRLAYRHKAWDPLFLKYLKKLESHKPVVVCGDFNVAHQEIDLARPKANMKTAGFTAEEREGFGNLIAAGFLDSFREFEKEGGHYTWWSLRSGARERNVGWRIDYFLISPALRPRLKKAWILSDVMGTDHCPVGIELK